MKGSCSGWASATPGRARLPPACRVLSSISGSPEDVRARPRVRKRRPSAVSSCQTVLANEQVVDGACWRCGDGRHPRLEQWFFGSPRTDQLLNGPTRSPSGRRGRLDAAELDRTLGARIGSRLCPRTVRAGARRRHRNLHHPHRHHLWRHLRLAGARACDGRSVREGECRSDSASRPGGRLPRARP